MTLAQAIEQAQSRNEQQLAARSAAPALELDCRLLNRFATFCKERGVRCVPASVAAFIKAEYAGGTQPDEILKTLQTIEAWEVNNHRANPIATPTVRSVLMEILKIEPPRWNKEEQLI